MRRSLPALGLLLASACGGAAGPVVDEVTPGHAREGERVEVSIRGAGFLWRYDASQERVEGSFKARVGGELVEELRWIDASELRGVVPGTLLVGEHDVEVEGPTGKDTKAGAFEVIAAPPGDGDGGVVDGG